MELRAASRPDSFQQTPRKEKESKELKMFLPYV
jgi:hypothetical protein